MSFITVNNVKYYSECQKCGKDKDTLSAQSRALCGSCALKGKPKSESHCKNMGIARSIAAGGDGTPKHYPGLARWTRLIKKRDGECVHCHSKEKLEAHHLLPKIKFPQFATELWNGLTLCVPCHNIAHGKITNV